MGRKPRPHTLFYHQLRGSLLALLVALSVIGGGIYHLSEQALLRNVENNLQYHADFRKERILALFEWQKRWIIEISEQSGLSAFSEQLLNSYHSAGAESPLYQQLRDRFRNDYQTLLQSQQVEDLFLITPQGELAFSLRPLEGEIGELLTRDGFYGETLLSQLIARVLEQRQLSISRYGKIELIEPSTALMGTPVYASGSGREREIVGVLVRPFALQQLHQLLKSYEGLGESGEVVIAQRRGEGAGSGVNFINHFRHGDNAQPNSPCLQQRITQPELFPIHHALSQTNGAGWMIDNACKPVYGVWTWIPELEWGMVVKQDRDEIMQPVLSMRDNVLLAVPVMVLMLIWLVHRQARMLARPIEQLTQASERGEITTLSSGPISEVNLLTLTLQQLVMVLEESRQSLDQKVRQRTSQLKQQSCEMESILASMQEGLLVVDQQGRITRVNQKLMELLECDQLEQLQGRHAAALFTDDSGLLLHAPRSIESFVGSGHTSSERKLKSYSGAEIPVQLSGALLQTLDAQHQVSGAVLIAHDLRERIEAEEERRRQANRLSYQEGLAEMSANVLHNIGNAVAGLSGRAEMIHSTLAPLQQIQQQLQQAATLEELPLLQQGLVQLSEILQQLQQERLAPSSQALIEAIQHISDTITTQQQMALGRPSINSRFHLRQEIEKIVNLQRESNRRLQIETRLQIDPALDEVTLPQNQFMQMVNNLMKNSREAIAEQQQQDGSGNHTITLVLSALPGQRFALRISDTGVGIPEQLQREIFQRNMTTKSDGSGIGLHSVSTFVGSLQGSIAVESGGQNQGTCFIIELPQDGSCARKPTP